MKTIVLDGQGLTLEAFFQVAKDFYPVEIKPEVRNKIIAARQVLFDKAATGFPVYGLNRGVGWNKDKDFDPDFFNQYNLNLINTHSIGVEPYHAIEEVRGILLARLNTALVGSTGISMEILDMYVEFLNRGIHPQIPSRGSIGEGDITTLPFVGQAMLGFGLVEYKGQMLNAKDVLEKEGLTTVTLGPKDGLSIVSSNAQGAAMAAFIYAKAEELVKMSELIFCLGLEGLNGGVGPLGEIANARRGLPGQIRSAATCRNHLKGSFLYEPDPDRALQDPVSFRCGSAIFGAAWDALEYLKPMLLVQLNSTDDNPCIFPEEGELSVSQNFEVLSLVQGLEMLAISLAHISRNICYQTIHLADPAFTGLSRFLTPCDVKTIAFGTIQKLFTSLDAENRHNANPSSPEYLALAGSIEDHASNLPFVARKVLKTIDNLYYMLGIELMHGAQAVDLRKATPLGEHTQKAYNMFREVVAYWDKDRNISIDIIAAYEFVKSGCLLKLAEDK